MAYGNYNPAWVGTGATNENDFVNVLNRQRAIAQEQEARARAKEEAEAQRQAELDALPKQEQANRNMMAQAQRDQLEHSQEMEERRFKDPLKNMGSQSLANILNQPALLAAKNIGGMGRGGGFEQSFRQSLGGGFSSSGPGYHYA